MEKRVFSWKLIYIPVLVVGIIFGSQVVYHTVERFLWSREMGSKVIFHPELPACGDKKEFFTVSPIKLGDYRNVVPLGMLGPEGGHVIPTKHSYFMSPATDVIEQTDVNVYSPGDLYVTWAERVVNKNVGSEEYFIYTAPCSDVELNIYHLNTVDQRIVDQLDDPKGGRCQDTQAGDISYNFCGKVIKKIRFKAGELLGTANPAKKGGIKQLIDFEMSDHRTPDLKFANPKRWIGGFDFKHIVCPFDYFTPVLRDRFFSQMADYDDPSMKRTAEPLCGEYMQDVAGTAQGVWFKPGVTADDEENNVISLVHHNIQTQKGIFAIGTLAVNTIEAGAYPFNPRSKGNINRDFKDISADGNVYCFEPTGMTGNYNYPFRIILQMTSSTEIKIEGQGVQGCGEGPWEFSEQATNFER